MQVQIELQTQPHKCSHHSDLANVVRTIYNVGAGASVEKLGEAAACAVKRIHLDHRMIQVILTLHCLAVVQL
jgi:hypothetical protein